MKLPLSRFEVRIVLALLIPALAPIVASLLFIPQLIQSRFAELSHGEVKQQLDRHAVFYSVFLESKKREYSATARTLGLDPILVDLAASGEQEAMQERLTQFIEDHEELWSAEVRSEDGGLLASVTRRGDLGRYRPKTLTVPLGLGRAPSLELTFVLSNEYFSNQIEAEEVATLYDVSLRTFGQRFNEKEQTYYAILAAVVLIALVSGLWLSRGVTRRIANLAAGTERVARGDLDFELPASGRDEIEELTVRFNRMLRAMSEAQRRIIDLEKISGWQDFARRLAHEIKNPLTPIRLAVQELKRRAPENDPQLAKLLVDVAEVVEDETSRLTRLVNEFSQFARLPDVHPVTTDLRTFVQDFHRAYNGFEGRVTIDVPERSLHANVDQDQMRQVMHNLVMNGLHASSETDGTVRIRVHGGGHEAFIEVQDDGPGVPGADVPKIFEPYFTTKTTGTGLGLAIVKKIVLQHDGSVSVRNLPTGGAQFVVRLPTASP